MKDKIFTALLAFTLMLTLVGCGGSVPAGTNNGGNTANTTTTGNIIGTTATEPTSDNSADEQDIGTADGTTFEDGAPSDSGVTSGIDGLYTYTVDGVEFELQTNIWDYIDSENIWHCDEMMADLGYALAASAVYAVGGSSDYGRVGVGTVKHDGDTQYYAVVGFSTSEGGGNVELHNASAAEYQYRFAGGWLVSYGEIVVYTYAAEFKLTSPDDDPFAGKLTPTAWGPRYYNIYE